MEQTQQAANNPTIWKLTVYRSRWSKRVDGYAHYEGPRRCDVLALMQRFLDAGGYGAAAANCREALSGVKRYTLKRERFHSAYLAQDLRWRGWDSEAWKQTPPAAYAITAEGM
jgi:hypothetical protein